MSIHVVEANPNYIHIICCENVGGPYRVVHLSIAIQISIKEDFFGAKFKGYSQSIVTPSYILMTLIKYYTRREKIGLRPCSQSQIDLFKKFLSDFSLMDFDVKGCKYTWFSNLREQFVIKDRIDKCVANWEWSCYPNAVVEVIPVVTLDHCHPILMAIPKVGDAWRFKYEAFWEDHEKCVDVVMRG